MKQPRYPTTLDPKQVRVLSGKAPWAAWFNSPARPNAHQFLKELEGVAPAE